MEQTGKVNFERQYYALFNRVTDAIRELENDHSIQAMEILKKAQQEGEERYITGYDDHVEKN